MSDAAVSPSDASGKFLSPTEWRVFTVLSRKGRALTVRQLVAEFEKIPGANRSYTTILTLAQRLAAKGYLIEGPKAASSGPAAAISYSTAISYEEALRMHTERFLAQFALNERDSLLVVSAVVAEQLANQ